jgi:dihydroflavonol-4-reductase
MRQIGITGAFGFLGSNFISAIIDKKRNGDPEWAEARIIAFSSSSARNPKFSNEDVETRYLDIMDYEDLVKNFEGLDAIAHFAGKVDDSANSREKIWDINVLGTRNVFDAALATGVKRVLYVSSICTLGRSGEGGRADERSSPYGDSLWPISFSSSSEAFACVDSPRGADPAFFKKMKAVYFDSKLAALELSRQYARERGLPLVTIFPGTVVGAGDMHNGISKLVNKVWDGELLFTFEGGTSFVTADDLTGGALLALAKGALGEEYVISGGDGLNMKHADFQRLVMRLSGRSTGAVVPLPIAVPCGLAIPVCSVASFLHPGTSLTSAFACSGSVDNFCSSAKAMRELGYAPKDELVDAIIACRRFSEMLGKQSSPRDEKWRRLILAPGARLS